MLNNKYWDERYLNNQKGWDVGEITTPIKQFVDGVENREMAILIPGCGNAYEAEYLLKKGFNNITLLDISPVLGADIVKKFGQYIGSSLKVVCADFFEFEGAYDLILEQTFFCAIDPSMRRKYVDKVVELLNPSGKLAGVLFNMEFDMQGPPFGGNREEYLTLFEKKLVIEKMELCYNSIKPREDNELFFIATKKDVK